MPVAGQPTLCCSEWNTAVASGKRQRNVIFKMRPKHGEALHSQFALLLRQRSRNRLCFMDFRHRFNNL